MDITQLFEDLANEVGSNAGQVLIAEQVGRIADVLRTYLDDAHSPSFYLTEPDSSVSYGDEASGVVGRYRELSGEYGHQAANILLAEAFADLANVVEKLKSQNTELPVAGLEFTVPPKPDPKDPNKVSFSTSDPDTKLERLFKKNMK